MIYKNRIQRLLLFILMIPGTIFALQGQNKKGANEDKIIDDPEIPAIYTGGPGEMNKFISNNLSYPADAVERNAQGLVVYTFVVEKDGTLSNFNLIHRADSLLNEEALRILRLMPPWRPAKLKGDAVRSSTYVPMYFRLNKNARVAQRNTPQNPTAKTNRKIIDSEVYTIVDKMPVYMYGDKALSDFISHQMRYPKEARQQGIQGRIICSFIVAADGSVCNVEVVQGINSQLDKEAVRVLSLMPRWVPGERNGEKVNVKCLLPIDFEIDETPIPPFEPQG